MAAGDPPRGGAGGGPGVPAIGTYRPALIAAALAGLLALFPLLYGSGGAGLGLPWLPPLQLLGWVALVGFGAAGRPVLAGLGLLLVAGPVGVVLVERGPELLAVPLGAAILLAGEAAFLAADLSGPGPTDGGALRWRLLLGLGVVALGMGAALLVLVVAALPGRGGVGLTLLGVAAALALLLGVGWATRTRLGL